MQLLGTKAHNQLVYALLCGGCAALHCVVWLQKKTLPEQWQLRTSNWRFLTAILPYLGPPTFTLGRIWAPFSTGVCVHAIGPDCCCGTCASWQAVRQFSTWIDSTAIPPLAVAAAAAAAAVRCASSITCQALRHASRQYKHCAMMLPSTYLNLSQTVSVWVCVLHLQ